MALSQPLRAFVERHNIVSILFDRLLVGGLMNDYEVAEPPLLRALQQAGLRSYVVSSGDSLRRLLDSASSYPASTLPATYPRPALVSSRGSPLHGVATECHLPTILLTAASAPSSAALSKFEFELPCLGDSASADDNAAAFAAALLGQPRALEPGIYTFGPHAITSGQVFHSTRHSLCLTNLKPVVPGHVLVLPRRRVPRMRDLAIEEVEDLWRTVQRVGRVLEAHHSADSLSIALQDGPAAGQTVPHVHVHILPRHVMDLEDNDAVYGLIDESEAAHNSNDPGVVIGGGGGGKHASIAPDPTSTHSAPVSASLEGGVRFPSPVERAVIRGKPLQVPSTHGVRSVGEMEEEAAVYRALLAGEQEEGVDPF